MTAEVAVLNRIGVALAADSAVTVGPSATKIYTSADKLFQLNRSGSVGIMVYGNANFVGLPWETIIKSYRAASISSGLASIEQHVSHFMEYLQSNAGMFPPEMQRRQCSILMDALYAMVIQEIREETDAVVKLRGGEPVNEAEVPELVERVIQKSYDEICRIDRMTGFNDEDPVQIRESHLQEIDAAIENAFEQLPRTDRSRELLRMLASEMLSRRCLGPLKSGVVIAGFGEKEYLPTLTNVELEEMVANKPRFVEAQTVTISHKSDASIVPFAQREPVTQFLEGVDPRFHGYAKQTTTDLVKGAIAVILDRLGENDAEGAERLRQAVNPEVDEMLEELFAAWNTQKNQFWRPIVKIVASLPKDELAAIAEALVNLTKFRRRVTPDRETVGGPIDVAVITKGDGFVWIRRKHYFDPALNPRVMARLRLEEPA